MTGKVTAAFVVVAFLAMVVSSSPSRIAAAAPSPAEAAFERLKSLAGTWETIDKATKRPGTATYTVTGGGKVVIEVMGGMATAYHFDKGTLMMTHYCGAGNQPRMKAKAIDADGRRIAFEMYDITNLKGPDAYRSTSLDVQFHNDGTTDLAYGGWSAGESSTQTFQLQRRTSTTTR